MKLKKNFKPLLFLMLLLIISSFSRISTIKIAVLKYDGGGDWYSNPTAITNLALFANQNLETQIDPDYDEVEVGSVDLFTYPFVHMTGHGNVVFSEGQASNLRTYLLSGGFLHIDDNYGLDQFLRPELKKVFPEYELSPISPDHPIFHQTFDFPKGLPKIHEHDKKAPEAHGIFHQGQLILLYTTECDLGDGWEDQEVHNDPQEIRLKALQMGSNILEYAFTRNEK